MIRGIEEKEDVGIITKPASAPRSHHDSESGCGRSALSGSMRGMGKREVMADYH